mmetsp:Transcript_18563/g.39858  ORF Transcript_18563/g.39858 Transcript_18563/m.39858 type:complete len:315 (+) Transcript_18563:147-1091(+)
MYRPQSKIRAQRKCHPSTEAKNTDTKPVIQRSAEASSSKLDRHELDLRQDYKVAVNCVIQCESIITALQEKLAKKDSQIASLERLIVKMSLELASAKASEDEHRLLNRKLMSSGRGASNDECFNEQQRETSRSPDDFEPEKIVNKNERMNQLQKRPQHRRLSQSLPTPFSSEELSSDISRIPSALALNQDEERSLNMVKRASALDLNQLIPLNNSAAGRRLTNLGQLLGLVDDTVAPNPTRGAAGGGSARKPDEEDIQKIVSGRPGRRSRRSSQVSQGRRRSSSLGSSMMSRVVFPSTFGDVVHGCLDEYDEWP